MKSLLETSPFRDAIQQVVAEEKQAAIEAMRTCVRANALQQAGAIEGGIAALEDLLGILGKYAAQAEQG